MGPSTPRMLTLTYITLAAIGCGYIVVSLALGHFFEGDGTFGHHDGGAADAFHFPLLSPMALATFGGATGAIGLVAQFGFRLSDGMSVLVALPGAFAFTYAVTYVAWRVLSTSVGTSALKAEDIAGADAEVITPIPAGGVGEAAAFVRGERFATSAREVSGLAVPRGAIVSVVRLAGSTLYVRSTPAGARETARLDSE